MWFRLLVKAGSKCPLTPNFPYLPYDLIKKNVLVTETWRDVKTAHVRNGSGLAEATAWGVGNFGLFAHRNWDGFVSYRMLSPHLRDVTELGPTLKVNTPNRVLTRFARAEEHL